MRISINEMKDYIRCPLFYKMKHLDEIPIDKDINEYFKDYFKLALYYYYFSLIDGKTKSVEAMMGRWEQLWFGAAMRDLFSEEELKEKSNEAVYMMTSFIQEFGSEKVTPIAVNFSYEAIFVGTENLHVTGDIDIIKILNDRTRKSETCIGFFNVSKHYADTFATKNDLEISVASYAFRTNFKSKEDKIGIYNLRNSSETPTLRTGGDYLRAEKAIRNIARAIKGGIYYPNSNAISCGKCPYKMFCLNDKSINTGGKLDELGS